jgi:hypothetical protein
MTSSQPSPAVYDADRYKIAIQEFFIDRDQLRKASARIDKVSVGSTNGCRQDIDYKPFVRILSIPGASAFK